jgi:hypothetical protein
MKVFRELSIRGPYELLQRLPDEIEGRLSGGWSRDRSREAETRPPELYKLHEDPGVYEKGDLYGEEPEMYRTDAGPELYCFHCEARPNWEAADLWLSLRNANELRVSNIIPSDVSELSYTQYNAILEEFAGFALPAARISGLDVEMSKPDLTIRDVFPPDVRRALVWFSDNANRSSGASHPRDKERWQRFVIEAHRAHTPLATDVLNDWLIAEGWTSDAAYKLTIEYENGRALLDQNQRQLQDA